MLGVGIAHFAVPRVYERIVPRLIGHPAFWVRWSGVAEIACAGLLVPTHTRRVGALATIGVLLIVFPAMSRWRSTGGSQASPSLWAHR